MAGEIDYPMADASITHSGSKLGHLVAIHRVVCNSVDGLLFRMRLSEEAEEMVAVVACLGRFFANEPCVGIAVA